MSLKRSSLVGGLAGLLIAHITYTIFKLNISVTNTAELFTISKLSPFVFIFIISIFIALLHSYSGGVKFITHFICVSVALGMVIGIIIGHIQFRVELMPLVILPTVALILGTGAGVSISKVEREAATTTNSSSV